MLSILLSAFLLAACTICMHAAGISLLLRYSTRTGAHPPTTPFAISRTLLRVVWWLLLLHLTEITLWALFYLWRGYLPDAEAAFYFSGVTYTTVGYGDIVLAKSYRLLAPLEGLVGVLMCSLSMGYFFVVVNRILQGQPQRSPSSSGEH
ncbi:potassium channel family protein [Tunturiibacter psychrotolerans]|uniref:potassium channel family protein n=1 Tax=Tunturiibacter psychrotolerans TaxID=3069686 RepID=UPI003D1D7344